MRITHVRLRCVSTVSLFVCFSFCFPSRDEAPSYNVFWVSWTAWESPLLFKCVCEPGRVVGQDGICQDHPCTHDGEGDPPCPVGQGCSPGVSIPFLPSWDGLLPCLHDIFFFCYIASVDPFDSSKRCELCADGLWSDGVQSCRDYCAEEEPCHTEAGSICTSLSESLPQNTTVDHSAPWFRPYLSFIHSFIPSDLILIFYFCTRFIVPDFR